MADNGNGNGIDDDNGNYNDNHTCNNNNDLVGKAVIIHNGQDDYVSQPSGASGIRIGCMEISYDIIESSQ